MLFNVPWWMLLFFAIGVYATVILLLKLLLAFGRTLPPPTADHFPEPGSREFLTTLSLAVDNPVRRGGTVHILNNGKEFFPALLEAIREARYSIHIMTYIWKKGAISDTVFEALIERARSGVEVRVMYDGIGSLFAPKEKIEALREAGGEVAAFAPVFSRHFLHFNRRNHRRAFVIDGRIAFTGGMSVADQWTGDAEDPDHWRDTMVRVTGPMAEAVQGVFMQLWSNIEGEMLGGPRYFLTPEEEDDHDMLHISVAHSPTAHVQPLRQFLWFSLRSAQESIYIANSYFAPDRHIRAALRERARAGLDVRILLPSKHTDNAFVRWATHALYDNFLEAGIRLYEYTPTMMHAKHLVIDGRWTIIGSANIDIRSFQLNHENVLGIKDEGFGREVRAFFDEDLERAREITLADWRRRPWWWWVRERLAVPLWAQY